MSPPCRTNNFSFYFSPLSGNLNSKYIHFPSLPQEKENGRLVPTPKRAPRSNRETSREPLLPSPSPIRLLLMAFLRFLQTLQGPQHFHPTRRTRHPQLPLLFLSREAHHIPHHHHPNTPKFHLAYQNRRKSPWFIHLANPTFTVKLSTFGFRYY